MDIEINEEPADVHMKLDDHGAAFFVEELSEDEEGQTRKNNVFNNETTCSI